jgi:mono/diheme cytochrome c family protein/rhodanese-related sulfurtransferase
MDFRLGNRRSTAGARLPTPHVAGARWARSIVQRATVVLWVTLVCVGVLLGSPERARAEPPPPREEAGRALYARYCKLCHAADGTGYAADNAPSLVSPTFLASASDEFIARGIRSGRPNTAMAAYGKALGGPLDDAQIAAIVRYLRTKGPSASALSAYSATGNATRGAAVFARECRKCHGTDDKRRTGPQLHNAEFLAAASPAFLRHAIAHGRPPTRMPAFEGRLKPGQIDDLVAWLVSQRPSSPSPSPAKAAAIPDDLPLIVHPDGAAPEFELRGGRFASAEQVARALAEQRRLIIIDARSPSDWIQFRIPGAVPIPYYDIAKLDRIPNDGTWVVAYCACPHHASGEVVDALRRRGFTRTAVLDEGILYWRQKGYPLAGEAARAQPAPPGF